MVKRKTSRARKQRSSHSENKTTVRSKFNNVTAVNSATLINALGSIGTDASSILVSDVNIASLTDIFRLFRINAFQIDFQPSTGSGTASVQIPSGLVGFVPYGGSTPTAITDFETPCVSNLTKPFGTASTTAPFTKDQVAHLKLSNKDMPVLDGPGGGWLATQQDGTQDNYGNLFWAVAATTAANTINWLAQYYFDISFKDLLDPSLIAANMQKHFPNGYPDHWMLKGGDAHCLAPFQQSAVTARRQRLLQPPLRSAALLAPPVSSKQGIRTPNQGVAPDVPVPYTMMNSPSIWSGPDPDFEVYMAKCKLAWLSRQNPAVLPAPPAISPPSSVATYGIQAADGSFCVNQPSSP